MKIQALLNGDVIFFDLETLELDELSAKLVYEAANDSTFQAYLPAHNVDRGYLRAVEYLVTKGVFIDKGKTEGRYYYELSPQAKPLCDGLSVLAGLVLMPGGGADGGLLEGLL